MVSKNSVWRYVQRFMHWCDWGKWEMICISCACAFCVVIYLWFHWWLLIDGHFACKVWSIPILGSEFAKVIRVSTVKLLSCSEKFCMRWHQFEFCVWRNLKFLPCTILRNLQKFFAFLQVILRWIWTNNDVIIIWSNLSEILSTFIDFIHGKSEIHHSHFVVQLPTFYRLCQML